MTAGAKPGAGLTGRALTVFNEMVGSGVAPRIAETQVARMRLPGYTAPGLSGEQKVLVEALTAPARAVYEAWRQAGYSHTSALEEVRASELIGGGTPLSEAEYDVRSAGTFTRPAGMKRGAEAVESRPSSTFSGGTVFS